ncbi:MAG TPA: leucyl/phenylalanyl-tRNA--protein transferase [Acidimicrobiia bacterium]|nr:leucyl/phenylalanyl-tRNA--protein transferase [Acidimicrobiia bacterium]
MTGAGPIEPPLSAFTFPDARSWGPDDCVAVGGDLAPGTLLRAYRSGLFPMNLPDGRLAWWSPAQRGILPLDGLRVTRSTRRSIRRYDVTVDGAFEAVVEGCADPQRSNGWITDDIVQAYVEMHELGWAHSVEAWMGAELVGGFYGVAIGGAFFGESMFHSRPDASKVALVRFVDAFAGSGGVLLDVQWATDHLVSLGAIEMPRDEYLVALAAAISAPAPNLWPR